MTSVTTFQYTYRIQAPADKLYKHLSEPTNYIGLSPLIVSLTDVQWDTNLHGQRFVQYKSVELFRFLGFIPYRNPLDVVMTLTIPHQQIVSEVQAPLNVRVIFTFDLEQQDSGSTVTETISIHSPLWAKRFVISQAKAVQQNRVQVLTSRMEMNTN
ncbi:MAG: SRPBCC family protein [Chloroflexi bacterium]|nr:SRPBCC family protein [Chloroflexota bacterium]MCC6894981.1 SRPBCC family protein [Anaerolineae bacterium]